ncbi:hypothetical protein IH992_30600 [Candidatus Poribacteria bacterium]|nr:hypothetical protein [Candidatus Poribacteria bacterium]
MGNERTIRLKGNPHIRDKNALITEVKAAGPTFEPLIWQKETISRE